MTIYTKGATFCYLDMLKQKKTIQCYIGAVILLLIGNYMVISWWIIQCPSMVLQCSPNISELEDALHSADILKLSPKLRSIFFHDTSFNGYMSPRQGCSVEAAARAHPRWQIYVLFSSPVSHHTLRTSCLAYLQELHNVKLAKVHFDKYSEGTVLQSILRIALERSKFTMQHLADILKILTLNKWGGIYLDTDMIVTKSLEGLPQNFIAKEADSNLGAGILSFAKDEAGTNIMNAVIKKISESYDPDEWNDASGPAFDSVITTMCPELINSTDYEDRTVNICNGITIFGYWQFYPIGYDFDELKLIFTPNSTLDLDLGEPYSYHMWNYLTKDFPIVKDSLYNVIAREHCPTIYSRYRDHFENKYVKPTPSNGTGGSSNVTV